MTTVPLRTVKDQFSHFVDRVEREHERVTIRRNGRPAAVLLSVEDLESLEETLAVLSDPAAMEAIKTGEAAIARGENVEGVEAVQALVPRSPKASTA